MPKNFISCSQAPAWEHNCKRSSCFLLFFIQEIAFKFWKLELGNEVLEGSKFDNVVKVLGKMQK